MAADVAVRPEGTLGRAAGLDLGRQEHFLHQRSVRIDLQQAVLARPGPVALARNPETAVRRQRDALGIVIPGTAPDRHDVHDPRRMAVRVDREDVAFRVERVPDGDEVAVGQSVHTGHGRERDRLAVDSLREDLRVGRLTARVGVDHDRRAHAELGIVDFAGDHEEVPLGDGQEAFGSERARQELAEARPSATVEVIGRDKAASLAADEELRLAAEVGELDGLGFRALVLRALLWVVAVLHGQALVAVAGVVSEVSVAAEDREAAAAAEQVAFVGRCDAVADPGDGVGFARNVVETLGQRDHAVLGGVDVDEVDAAEVEVTNDVAGVEIDDCNVVVLLQRHNRLVLPVDVHELWLGIFGRQCRQAR